MSARDQVFAAIRRSLGVTGAEAPRRREVADRIAGHPRGVIPARGQGSPQERLDLFVRMVEARGRQRRARRRSGRRARARSPTSCAAQSADGGAARRRSAARRHCRGSAPARSRSRPARRDAERCCRRVSHAFAGVAETGTLVLMSGADNPTSLNFLPDNHIVVVDAKDVAGDYETVWQRLREKFGDGVMPRTVNLITGPSRSADIEQTLILGAHGPRRLHVIVVGDAADP